MPPKSKKFSAAEKHFQKKEEKLRERMNEANTIAQTQQKRAEALEQEVAKLRAENEALKTANTTLQEAAGLTDEELELLIQRSRGLATVAQLFTRNPMLPY